MELDDHRAVGRLSLHADNRLRQLAAGDVEAAGRRRLVLTEGRRRRRTAAAAAAAAAVAAALAAAAGDQRVRAARQRVAEAGVADRREAPEAASVLVGPRDARQPAQGVLEPAAEPGRK